MASTVGKFSVTINRGNNAYVLDTSDIIDVNIIEDIFSFCVTGSVRFTDKMGFSEVKELTTNDFVIISYKEENLPIITKLFIIYDYAHILPVDSIANHSFTVTTLHLIEPFFLTLAHMKYSKAWGENVNGLVIIKDILSKFGGFDIDKLKDFEEINETFDNFYMPYWTPIEGLNWLLSRCSSAINNTAGLLLYSNKNGMNLKSIESLVTSPIREKNFDGSLTKYVFSNENSDGYNQILEWDIDPPDLHATKFLSGHSKSVTNTSTKTLDVVDFDYKTMIEKYSLLGNRTLFGDISNTKTNLSISCEQKPEFVNNMVENSFIQRYAKQLVTTLVVRGHTRRYAGMLIDVSWKSSMKGRPENKMYNGLHLVCRVNHSLNNGSHHMPTPNYKQQLTCLKMSYGDLSMIDLHKTKSSKVIRDKIKK